MKNLQLTLLSAVVIFFGSCNTDCAEGSGNQVSETREISNFSGIEVKGSLRLVISPDSSASLRVVADDNIQDEIRTKVSGNDLVIEHESGTCEAGEIIVFVGSKQLKEIDAKGTVQIVSIGKLNADDFKLELSGACTVNLEIDAGSLKTRSSGSSEITLSGQAGTHDLEMSGSSKIDAFNFIVGKYFIESSGSSSSQINVLSELEVKSNGASDITYKGNPARVKSNDSGASSIRKVN